MGKEHRRDEMGEEEKVGQQIKTVLFFGLFFFFSFHLFLLVGG